MNDKTRERWITFPLTYDESASPKCPVCDDVWLHQGAVHVFDRAVKPTKDTYTKTPVGLWWTGGDLKPENNPSEDREGVLIEFTCETCFFDTSARLPRLFLAIAQGEGTTAMHWRVLLPKWWQESVRRLLTAKSLGPHA